MGMYEIVLFKSTVVLGISSQLLPGSELVDDFWFVSLMNFAGTVDLQSRPSGDSLLRSNSFGTSKIRAPPRIHLLREGRIVTRHLRLLTLNCFRIGSTRCPSGFTRRPRNVSLKPMVGPELRTAARIYGL